MVKEVENRVFRIRTTSRSYLVEVYADDIILELAEFCAERCVIYGEVITSVVEIFPHDVRTPKVRILSNPAFKEKVRELIRAQISNN